MVVVDCSIAAASVLEEAAPDDPPALLFEAIARGLVAHVPPLFWYEIRNAVVMAERRRRLTAPEADRALVLVGRLDLVSDDAGKADFDLIASLARRHGLTVYDAAYVELALRRGAALASLDGAMIRAAAAEGVEIFA